VVIYILDIIKRILTADFLYQDKQRGAIVFTY